MNTHTNRQPQHCFECGAMVPAGEGRLWYLDDEDADDFLPLFGQRVRVGPSAGWKVTHLDSDLCRRLREQALAAAAARQAAAEQGRAAANADVGCVS